MSKAGLKTGAIGFVDALGFKGIWQREDVRSDPMAVVRKLLSITRQVPGYIGSGQARRQVSVAFLSDTVVIGVSEGIAEFAKLDGVSAPGIAILGAALLTQWVTRKMAEQPAPLSVRGCITSGKYAIVDRFVMGPAVDEAAMNAGIAEAAVVWLTPRAVKAVAPSSHRSALVPWGVPIKGGGRFKTLCVSPFEAPEAAASTEGDRAQFKARLLATFDSDRVEVAMKRQETAQFLEVAERHHLANARKSAKKAGE